jgi:cation-transporting ATPase 13A3/4/5
VSKTPLPPPEAGGADALYDGARHKRHTLFAGTAVLQAAEGAAAIAVVTHTGLATQKGQLLQSLMFPAPLELHYEAQARLMLAALLVYSLVTFGITAYFFKALTAQLLLGTPCARADAQRLLRRARACR